MFVGNCGAHGRTARVVFGERLNLALTLLQHELGRGRILLTDHIAVSLPPNFVAPVDHIIPLRGGTESVQLFQLLNPLRCRDGVYVEGAVQFRHAFASAINGDYPKAMKLVKAVAPYDVEVCNAFTKALQCLIASKPYRPRYCRFQLPAFEPLGTLLKNKAAKYTYRKLSLDKIQVPALQDSSQIIGFGFESVSSLSTFFKDTGCLPRMGGVGENPPDSSRNGDDTDAPSATTKDPNPSGKVESANPSASQPLHTSLDPLFPSSPITPGEGGAFDEEVPRTVVDCTGTTWHLLPDPIDAGAFAEVYKAISNTGTIMALKCIRLISHHVQLHDVVQEVNTACKLFNEYIVNYTSWAHIGPYLIIIMDYIAGGSLQWVLSSFPQGMPLRLVKRYASDSLKGLSYLHSHNIVHADIKPGNILISVDGGCKLSDFGSSINRRGAGRGASPLAREDRPPPRLMESEQQQQKEEEEDDGVFGLRGTARYMSPEVARGSMPTAYSDVWSLGVTLHEMLTGRLPWVWAKTTPRRTDRDGGNPEKLKRDPATGVPRTPPAFFLDPQEHNIPSLSDLNDNADGLRGGSDGGGFLLKSLPIPTKARRRSNPSDSDERLLRRFLSPTMTTTSPLPSGEVGNSGGDPTARKVSISSPCEKGNDDKPSFVRPHFNPHALRSRASPGDPLRGCSPRLPIDSLVELEGGSTSIHSISDARFVQGLANGTIEVRLQPEDFPSDEAFSLVSSCLRVTPRQRPSTAELLGHPFFII
ncbi:unnamed protein product, partial [Phytomonas sp. EM1]